MNIPFLLFLLLRSCLCDSVQAYLDHGISLSVLAQTMLLFNETIDQIPLVGINVSSTVFEPNGYSKSSLGTLATYLNVSNINSILLDVYWYDSLKAWHLCPRANMSSSCSDLSIPTVLSLIYDSREVLRHKGLLVFQLILFNLHEGLGVMKGEGTPSLSQALEKAFGNRTYTPMDQHDNGGVYPSLYDFLHSWMKNTVPLVWQNHAANASLSEEQGIFWNRVHTPSESDTLQGLSLLSWKIDTSDASFSGIKALLLRGTTAIINGPSLNTSEIDTVTWQWAYGQPITRAQQPGVGQDYVLPAAPDLLRAYQCAVLFEGALVTENCYELHLVACQSRSDRFHWKLSQSKKTYFEADENCQDSPQELFNFSLPKSGLVQSYLSELLVSQGITDPVWVDFNMIATNSCWVTGGPDSLCPFVKVDHNQRFVSMATPIAVFIVLGCSLMFFLSTQSVPVQRNRKYWKHLMTEFSKDEYEGVAA